MREVKGCGMRSAVGFLSQRKINGHPLMKEEFQRRRLAGCTSLYKKDMLGHFGCVNAIEFSNNGGEWLVSGGDDRRVLLWHMEKAIHSRAKPLKLKGEHLSNIFCLAFDSTNKRVFSGGNDEQVILHDVERGETLNVFLHDDSVYGLSVSPVNDNVFASSSDDGRVLIWDTREPPNGEPFCLANYPSAFHSVMFNPVEPRLLATANSKEGVGLWDIRKPRSSLLRYGGNLSLQSAMSVRFNSTGTQLLALRRRLPPVLYELHSRLPSFQFDNQGYFNSCTMKSCCFAGDRDQYILSGSDDFNLYMWRIPKDPEAGGPGRVVNGAFMVLKGHRSIVNQVRFNPHNYTICSSGVEKVIKMWSPYQQPGSMGDLEGRVDDDSRSLYTHEEYISLVLNSGSGLSHDYYSQSIQEDPRMMAFFDSLVRREIEGWSSDSDSDLSEGTILQLHARGRGRGEAAPAATPAAVLGGQSDSERSSSPSPVTPPVPEGADSPCPPPADMLIRQHQQTQRRRRRSYQGVSLLDLVNNSSDSSGDWPDPIPRPRSPSPRVNSSSSSSSSLAASSSSSSSEEEEDEEEQRRASIQQGNVSRRRPVRFCHQGEERPESSTARALCLGADSCSYPEITVAEPSTSEEEEEEAFPKAQGSSRRNKGRPGFHPNTPPGTSTETSAGEREGGVPDLGEEEEEEQEERENPSEAPPGHHFHEHPYLGKARPDGQMLNGNGVPKEQETGEGCLENSSDPLVIHPHPSPPSDNQEEEERSPSCSDSNHGSHANGQHHREQESRALGSQPRLSDTVPECLDVNRNVSVSSKQTGISTAATRLKRTRAAEEPDSENSHSEKKFRT
ncbi:DDB1- and CUL4-associated factor 5 [Huso huso]|uniref:DDB1- and CUL4-associated factor 5 n=1 Tax=Huso huso TaxID=61971 RepID=A0ABR0Z8G4_HUSHU